MTFELKVYACVGLYHNINHCDTDMFGYLM